MSKEKRVAKEGKMLVKWKAWQRRQEKRKGWQRRQEVGKAMLPGRQRCLWAAMLPGSPRPKSLKICKKVKEYSFHLLSLIPACWQQALVSGFSGGLETVVGLALSLLCVATLTGSAGRLWPPKLFSAKPSPGGWQLLSPLALSSYASWISSAKALLTGLNCVESRSSPSELLLVQKLIQE